MFSRSGSSQPSHLILSQSINIQDCPTPIRDLHCPIFNIHTNIILYPFTAEKRDVFLHLNTYIGLKKFDYQETSWGTDSDTGKVWDASASKDYPQAVMLPENTTF